MNIRTLKALWCRWTRHRWSRWAFYAMHADRERTVWERGYCWVCWRCSEEQFRDVEWAPVGAPAKPWVDSE